MAERIFFQRPKSPDAFLTPIPDVHTGDTDITIASINEKIRQQLGKYEIPEECYNNIENHEVTRHQLQVENYCIYGVLEGTVNLTTKIRRATLIGENVPAKSVKVKILKKGDIFFAPSMIIYLLSEDTTLNNRLWWEYDQQTTRITRYNYSGNFKEHFRNNYAAWLPAIKAIMNRTWDAVVAPLSDHPKIPEFQHQTNLPKKQYRRNDFLFGMSDKIYAEQVDGITPNGFVIFDNPEYNYSFDQENPILNENDEPNLIFVKEGTVKAVKKLQNTSNGVKEIVVTREANQLLGAFELFTEENSYFTIKSSLVMVPLEGGTIAAPLTKVVKIPKREIPLKLWLWLALNTLKNLTPIVQMMDFLIDLVFVEPGRTLYEKEKDEPNEIYVVLDGQFRMQYENKKGLKKIKEYHRGNKIGTKEALEIKPIHREHTLFATRPSVVARFHIELYNNLIRDFGKSGKTKPNIKPDNSITAAQMDQQYFSEIYTIRQMKYRKTVAILPASNSVNISDFVSELFIYTNAYIRGEHNRHLVKYLNKHSIGHREGTVLTGWLRHQEDNNLIVFYEGNHDLDDWTKMCIERADAIIIIENDIMNMPNGQPKGPADWLDKLNNTPLYHQFERTRRELIILWKEKFSGEIVKEVYRKFHNFNIWFSDYHNVYMNSQTFNLMNKVANQYLSGTPLQQIADNTTTQKILFSEKAAIFADVYTKTVEILGDRQLAEVLYKNANDLTLKFIFSDKKTIDDEIVSLRAQGASDQAIKQRICQFLYGMVTLQKKKDLVQKIDDLIDDLIPQDKQQDVKAQLSRSINLNDYPIDWDAIDWDAIDWDALELDTNTNIARIARFVSGYALGVAFGGGGAKGAAHYGILNELLMKEVPVDMVGGTSIGAFFGGLVAFAHLHTSTATTDMIDLIKEHLHTCFEKLGSSLDYWKNIINVAIKQATDKLPFSSDDLDKILNPIFKETCIEELSIPFFSVSTNISNSSMRVHCIGKNVLLRKCIAASMSLPGYYQPVIDDDSAHLVDGGCVNLLPADIMKAHGAYHVIAIDVGSIPKFVTEYQNRHKKVSKEDVQSTSIKPLDNVSSSATIVASQNLECLKTLDYCTYLRPVLKNPTSVNDDINNFKIDAFNKIGKILGLGEKYCKEIIQKDILDNAIIKHIMNPLETLMTIWQQNHNVEPNVRNLVINNYHNLVQ